MTIYHRGILIRCLSFQSSIWPGHFSCPISIFIWSQPHWQASQAWTPSTWTESAPSVQQRLLLRLPFKLGQNDCFVSQKSAKRHLSLHHTVTRTLRLFFIQRLHLTISATPGTLVKTYSWIGFFLSYNQDYVKIVNDKWICLYDVSLYDCGTICYI